MRVRIFLRDDHKYRLTPVATRVSVANTINMIVEVIQSPIIR
jgi:hypothetical protein